MADSLLEEFRRRAEEALAGHPGLRHEWAAETSRLRFPRVDDLGFDVEVCVGDREIAVHALGAHEHLADARRVVGRATGLRGRRRPHMRPAFLIVAAALSVFGLLTLQPVPVLDAGLILAAGLGMVVLWLVVAVPIMLGFIAIVSASRWLRASLGARRAA